MSQAQNLAVARRYIAALERGVTGKRLAAFFTPDVVQQEFPNRFVAKGVTRNLEQILEGAERGQSVLRSQTFEVLNAFASGNRIAMEVQWTGSFTIDVAGLPAGDEMRARFAVFLEFRNGKIARQRNYDCFDPW